MNQTLKNPERGGNGGVREDRKKKNEGGTRRKRKDGSIRRWKGLPLRRRRREEQLRMASSFLCFQLMQRPQKLAPSIKLNAIQTRVGTPYVILFHHNFSYEDRCGIGSWLGSYHSHPNPNPLKCFSSNRISCLVSIQYIFF